LQLPPDDTSAWCRASISDVRFDRRGSRLITASADKTARIWPLQKRGEPVALIGHTGAVNSASFSPDDARAATASEVEQREDSDIFGGDGQRFFLPVPNEQAGDRPIGVIVNWPSLLTKP
jgi:WD40 repeat protein